MTLERFWNHDLNPELAMQPFTWQHGILILLGILSVILTLKYAVRIKNLKFENRIKKGFALWLLFLEIIYHVHYWSYGMFSVPLHICSLGVMFSIMILLTDNKKIFEFLFFIGILGGLTALLIPNSLGYTYYNMRYYHFILLHMSIAIVPIYYYKAYDYRVTLKSVFKTMALILVLSPLVIFVNYATGKNYMFIGEKPAILANYLPDWPYYIIILLIAAVFALNTLYYMSNYGFDKIKSTIRRKRA